MLAEIGKLDGVVESLREELRQGREVLETERQVSAQARGEVSEARAAAKVRAAIARIETGNFGDVKPVGEGVSERRIDFGPGYPRVFRAGRATARDPAR